MKLILIFALLTFGSSAYSQEVIFNTQTQDFYEWIGSPFQSSSENPPSQFVDYKLLNPIAVHLMVKDVSKGWVIDRIRNYDYYGNPAPPSFELLKTSRTGAEERVLTGGYYYLSRMIDGQELKMVVSVGGSSFCRFGAAFYYPDSKVTQFRIAQAEYNRYLNAKNPFSLSVIHSVEDEYGYKCYTYLENVDDLKMEWDDLILQEDIKKDVYADTFAFIENFDVFKKAGLEQQKGLLFYGPPGTGKSFVGQILIAQSLNGVLKGKNSLIILTARHLESTGDVSMLFRVAKNLAPTTVFMEDIDLLGIQSRNSGSTGAARDQGILNEFLNGLDGLVSVSGALFIGTTNQVKNIDSALARSGRLGLHYPFPLPSYAERKLFFERFAVKKAQLEEGVTFEWLAGETEGLSGADIIEIIELTRQAAYLENSWAEPGKLLLKRSHFEHGLTMVRVGNSESNQGLLQSLRRMKRNRPIY